LSNFWVGMTTFTTGAANVTAGVVAAPMPETGSIAC
jgi:hypothetical protein